MTASPLGRRLGGALAAALLGLATSAAEAPAADVAALYAAYWAGLPAARIRLVLRDADAAYRNRIEIETQGLPYLLTRFRATAQAEGRLAVGRPAEPTRYLAVYDLRKRLDRRVSLQFEHRSGGTLAQRAADDTSRKPPLPEALRRNTVDPLSALQRIREALRARRDGGRFVVPVYDGARRFDIVGHVLPRRQPADGVIRAELTLRPIAGFKGETSEDGDPDGAPRKLDLTVTDDARTLPLSITVPVFFMPLMIQFERLCGEPERCSE